MIEDDIFAQLDEEILVPASPQNGQSTIPVEPSQPALFEKGEWWDQHWKGMPEFVQESTHPFHSIVLHFETRQHMEQFAALVKQPVGLSTKYAWYPEAKIVEAAHLRYMEADAEKILSEEASSDLDEEAWDPAEEQ